jgi:hypothetical protein
VVSWLTAAVLRPTKTRLVHYSVVDVDLTGSGGVGGADSADPWVRSQSWVNLFVPQFGHVPVSLESGLDPRTLLASQGLRTAQGETGFVSQQQYALPAADPQRVAFPMRSTTRGFNAHYLSNTQLLAESTQVTWDPTLVEPIEESGRRTAGGRLVSGRLSGELTHDLPGKLEMVKLLWARGDGRAFIWDQIDFPNPNYDPKRPADAKNEPTVKTWHPGQRLDLNALPPSPRAILRLPPKGRLQGGESYGSGYLADLLKNSNPSALGGADPASRQRANPAQVRRLTEALSFYNILPPPKYRVSGTYGGGSPHFTRPLGRSLDISHLMGLRRLIVIGYLHGQQAKLPMDLRVSGGQVPRTDAKSWTVVRWVLPIVDAPTQSTQVQP